MAGVTAQSVSDWENEKSRPARGRLRAISDRLTIPFEAFGEAGPRPADLVEARPNPGQGTANPPAQTREAAAQDAQRVAGEIVMRRLVGRKSVLMEEVVGYLAAVADAAAGRPITLPAAPESVEGLPSPGDTGTA